MVAYTLTICNCLSALCQKSQKPITLHEWIFIDCSKLLNLKGHGFRTSSLKSCKIFPGNFALNFIC